MKKALYKFQLDCGRMGELEGLFISTQEKVDKLVESRIEVYFGEVLGKHSEVYGSIDKDEIIFVSDNEEVIKVIEDNKLTMGYNPFDYTSVHFDLEGEDLDDLTIDDIIDILLEKQKL